MSIEITKVKLIKDGKKLLVGIKESGKLKANGDKTCHNPCHPDLITAVHSLSPHMAYLTHSESKSKENDAFIEKFTVSGFSIGGKEDEEGIVITGYKSVDHGTVILNSPFVLFGAEPGARYINMDRLITQKDVIDKEVRAYLFENKHGEESPEEEDDNQLGMFDEDGQPITNIQIQEPVKVGKKGQIVEADKDAMELVAANDKPKGKGGRKKVKQTAETPSGEVEE